jgi:hypothetical protein
MLEHFLARAEYFVTHVTQLDRVQWLWVFCLVVIVGFTCMRGFGSRVNY